MHKVRALILALNVAFSGLAEARTEIVEQKHRAYQDAIATVESKIEAFQSMVAGCNPPFQDQIAQKVFDLTNPESGLSALRSHRADVEGQVLATESRFAAARDESRRCADRARLLGRVEAVAQDARDGLAAALARYKSGVEAARAAAGTKLTLILKMRASSPTLVEGKVGKGEVSQCNAALRQIDVIYAASGDAQAKLADLQSSFQERLEDEKAALLTPGSCAGALSKPAQPADEREEEGAYPAGEAETQLAL